MIYIDIYIREKEIERISPFRSKSNLLLFVPFLYEWRNVKKRNMPRLMLTPRFSHPLQHFTSKTKQEFVKAFQVALEVHKSKVNSIILHSISIICD